MKIKVINLKKNKIIWYKKIQEIRYITNYYILIEKNEIKYLDKEYNIIVNIKKERKDKN